MFFHVLSFSFIFFHFLLVSFIFFHFLSFSFSIFCFLSFSFFCFSFLSGAQNLIFWGLNVVTISLDSSKKKSIFLPSFWPISGGKPLFVLFSCISSFFLPFFLALPVVYQLVTIWFSVKIRLRVVYGERRAGQVLPSYQNRQISALDEAADAPQSSLFSLLSSCSSCLFSALLISSLV